MGYKECDNWGGGIINIQLKHDENSVYIDSILYNILRQNNIPYKIDYQTGILALQNEEDYDKVMKLKDLEEEKLKEFKSSVSEKPIIPKSTAPKKKKGALFWISQQDFIAIGRKST